MSRYCAAPLSVLMSVLVHMLPSPLSDAVEKSAEESTGTGESSARHR